MANLSHVEPDWRDEIYPEEPQGKDKGMQLISPTFGLRQNPPAPEPAHEKVSNETFLETKASSNIPGPREVLTKRNVNGIWDPSHATDITVHLKMPLQEDLSEIFEELCRLQRLGDFASARRWFTENLQEYLDNPQIIIGYAEMLLEQGDYKALAEFNHGATPEAWANLADSSDALLLTTYWELLQILRTRFNPERPYPLGNATDRAIDRAIDVLRKISPDNRNITSTEIRMLALLYRLGYWAFRSIFERLHDIFSLRFYKVLYKTLLSQGRIWDVRDIAVALARVDIDLLHQLGGTQAIIKDWSSSASDSSTTLALLDIFVSQNDPGNMKSRPFTRWMLAKSRLSDIKGPNYTYCLIKHFQSYPGLVLRPRTFLLPQYVSAKGENPGWSLHGAAPELERPARMAMRASRELGDYGTEAMALQRLITLSTNPFKEFEELCNLQKVIQGDIWGYSMTLASKYPISNTNKLKRDLKMELSEFFDIPKFGACLATMDVWVLKRLRYTLEDGGPAARRALGKSDENYKFLPKELQRMISEKFPDIPRRVGQTISDPQKAKVNQAERQNENLSKKGKAPEAAENTERDQLKIRRGGRPSSIQFDDKEDEWTDESSESDCRAPVLQYSQLKSNVSSSRPGEVSSQELHPILRSISFARGESKIGLENDSLKASNMGDQSETPQQAAPEQKKDGKEKEQKDESGTKNEYKEQHSSPTCLETSENRLGEAQKATSVDENVGEELAGKEAESEQSEVELTATEETKPLSDDLATTVQDVKDSGEGTGEFPVHLSGHDIT
ncbi:hypothetical protein F5Y13DRAFT_203258 [Hypoxylon sp. FL1857]|nr:hypothetical protein F5Y13DRAFT_203258 [Hypoxylon sp. FL1857]